MMYTHIYRNSRWFERETAPPMDSHLHHCPVCSRKLKPKVCAGYVRRANEGRPYVVVRSLTPLQDTQTEANAPSVKPIRPPTSGGSTVMHPDQAHTDALSVIRPFSLCSAGTSLSTQADETSWCAPLHSVPTLLTPDTEFNILSARTTLLRIADGSIPHRQI